MAQKLHHLSTQDMREQMSIYGNPDKLVKMMNDIFGVMWAALDTNNPAELTNADFALRRIRAELKQVIRRKNDQQYIK